MILFDNVVEIFDVPSFTGFRDVSFCLELVEGFGVRGVFVHIVDSWFARMRGGERFEKEEFHGLRISRRAEKEIERVSLPVNCPREIGPFLVDFDGRLITTPGVCRGLQMGTATLFEFRSILLDPSVNGGMIDVQTTFQHDLLEISITVRRTQIPPHAEEKDVGLEMALFERILLGHGGSSFALFPHLIRSASFLQHNLTDCLLFL